MNTLIYFYFFLGFLGNYLIGRLIFKSDWSITLLFGTCISGLILSISAWIIPSLTHEIIFFLFLIGLISFFYDLVKKEVKFNINLYSICSIFFFLTLFIYFSYNLYPFNNHDPLYWGISFELLKADYLGPLRVPTFYPEQFAITHVLPSAVLSSLLVFVQDINLVNIIQAKYIFISLILAGLTSKFLSTLSNANKKYLIAAFIFCFYIFENEISFNLLTSSYLFMLIIGTIFILSIDDRDNYQELILLSLLLTISKGPLFYLGLFLLIYYFIYFKEYRFTKITISSSLLTILVLTTWAILPKPNEFGGCSNPAFSLMNPFNLESLASVTLFREWLMPDVFGNFIFKTTNDTNFFQIQANLYENDSIKAIFTGILIMIYFLLKYYTVILVGGYKLIRSNRLSRAQEIKIKGLIFISILSIFGWIFIRNGFHVAHQAHSYLLISTLSILMIVKLVDLKPRNLAIVFVIGTIFALSKELLSFPFQESLSKGITSKYISYNEINPSSIDVFYQPIDGEKMWETELMALLSGKRVLKNDYNQLNLKSEFFGEDGIKTSIMPAWIITTDFPKKCQ